MPSQDPPAATLLDRLIEDAAKDSFSIDKSAQLMLYAYTNERAKYQAIINILKRKNKDKYNAVMCIMNQSVNNVVSIDGGSVNSHTIKGIFPNAPVDDDAIIPHGWTIRPAVNGQSAIAKLRASDGNSIGVLSHPMIVSGVLEDVTTGDVMLELSWQFTPGGRWRSKIIEKSKFGSKSGFAVEVARWGTGVNANNVGGVIEWLTDYQTANVTTTKTAKASSQLGWYDSGFILPGECVGGYSDIRYYARNEGCEQATDAIRAVGTIDGWVKAISELGQYPYVITGLYAALSSVLLEPLTPNDGNPIIDWSYRTSSGKTTTMQIASSVWGSQRGVMFAWSATRFGAIERAASTSHLPLIMDDSKQARQSHGRSAITDIIYDLSNGSGSVRSSTNGLRATAKFRTVLLSTGEDKAIDADKSAGTVARVLSVWGSPFGGESEAIGDLINRVKDGIEEHNGLAGPMFVKYVVRNKMHWPQWRKDLADVVERVRNELSGASKEKKGVLNRSAKVIALLQVTANVAHKCIPFPWPTPDLVPALLPVITKETSQANRELEALRHLFGVINSSPGRVVCDRAQYDATVGSVNLLGIQDSARYHIAMFDPCLIDTLRHGGYNPMSIKRVWFEQGWLESGECETLHGERMMIITNKAVDAAAKEE